MHASREKWGGITGFKRDTFADLSGLGQAKRRGAWRIEERKEQGEKDWIGGKITENERRRKREGNRKWKTVYM